MFIAGPQIFLKLQSLDHIFRRDAKSTIIKPMGALDRHGISSCFLPFQQIWHQNLCNKALFSLPGPANASEHVQSSFYSERGLPASQKQNNHPFQTSGSVSRIVLCTSQNLERIATNFDLFHPLVSFPSSKSSRQSTWVPSHPAQCGNGLIRLCLPGTLFPAGLTPLLDRVVNFTRRGVEPYCRWTRTLPAVALAALLRPMGHDRYSFSCF